MCETCQNAEHNKNISRKARPVKVESPWEVLGLDIHGECLQLTDFFQGFHASHQEAWQTYCRCLCLCEEVPRRPQQPTKVQPDPCGWLGSLSTHSGSCGHALLPRIETVMGVFLLTKLTEIYWPNDIAGESCGHFRSNCFVGLGF